MLFEGFKHGSLQTWRTLFSGFLFIYIYWLSGNKYLPEFTCWVVIQHLQSCKQSWERIHRCRFVIWLIKISQKDLGCKENTRENSAFLLRDIHALFTPKINTRPGWSSHEGTTLRASVLTSSPQTFLCLLLYQKIKRLSHWVSPGCFLKFVCVHEEVFTCLERHKMCQCNDEWQMECLGATSKWSAPLSNTQHGF